MRLESERLSAISNCQSPIVDCEMPRNLPSLGIQLEICNWKSAMFSVPAFFANERFVVGGRKQATQFGWILERDLNHPGLVGIFIDLFRGGRQFTIHVRDRSTRRRVQIGNRLHRLYRA